MKDEDEGYSHHKSIIIDVIITPPTLSLDRIHRHPHLSLAASHHPPRIHLKIPINRQLHPTAHSWLPAISPGQTHLSLITDRKAQTHFFPHRAGHRQDIRSLLLSLRIIHRKCSSFDLRKRLLLGHRSKHEAGTLSWELPDRLRGRHPHKHSHISALVEAHPKLGTAPLLIMGIGLPLGRHRHDRPAAPPSPLMVRHEILHKVGPLGSRAGQMERKHP